MIPQTETARRTSAGAGLRVTDVHRQPRPADPDLVNLDRRITALADRGRMEPAQRCRVVLLRRKLDWLIRDRPAGGGRWLSDAANLELAISREEGQRT